MNETIIITINSIQYNNNNKTLCITSYNILPLYRLYLTFKNLDSYTIHKSHSFSQPIILTDSMRLWLWLRVCVPQMPQSMFELLFSLKRCNVTWSQPNKLMINSSRERRIISYYTVIEI